ncbi:TIGR00304 family protein [Archaeoglobus sulfaticallidus PM70-1]|uniref:TIGR00304 family protein n=1 Tax=Archaeoglobus sulfaticallidus PM70-1 TaxID=387631 RepID=N0BHW5_9EURY|nr:TIGR00304 family protein [Archaeoglobus sulfaticallidus]AGK61902.1 TIGR00304 family protein [Archaeoglobus sulfaticallidus PM70-1]
MLGIIAMLIILTGILLIFFGLISRPPDYEEWRDWDEEMEEIDYRKVDAKKMDTEPRREVKSAGIVMIGPIPIIFGDSRMALYLAILAIFMMFLFLITIRGWFAV